MAKELMEIGGFITSGAEIVNHDASLSGNGTVDSPLGLNETVLWSNDLTANSAISAFTTNEKVSNFERVRFEGYVNGGYFVSEIPNYSIIDNTLRFGTVAYSPDNYGSPLEMYGVSYASDNGTSFTGVRTTLRWCNQTITSALQGTNAVTWPVLGKIVGINRKAQ